MYLKSLEINGFKSFSKKGSFDFKSQISGIVGPNGSGKSNVAEAFRFVLGEQSLKNMRSKKGTDLIFAGNKGQLNRGSVQVVFDNSDRQLDIDYNEVVIERVVLRDGTNEYSINKNKVRAKDVTELLAAANIGSGGHHIISQGEADKILIINARERKQMIEEALGLKTYIIKKNESVRKLEKTKEHLREIKQEERSTGPRLAQLRREVEKIDRARELRQELRTLYMAYFPCKQHSQKQADDTATVLESLQSSAADIRAEIATHTAQMNDAVSAEHIKQAQQTRADTEQQLVEIRSNRQHAERQIGKLDAIIEIAESKQRQATQLPAEAAQRRELVAGTVHSIWTTWATDVLDTETLSDERTARWQSQMCSYDQLPDAAQDQDRQYADQILHSLGESNDTVDDYDPSVIQQHTAERAQLLEDIAAISAQEQSVSASLDALEQQLQSPQVTTQKMQISILELEKQLAEIQSQQQTARRTADDLQAVLARFDVEQVYAQDLFGAESADFVSAPYNESADLNLTEKIIRTRTLIEHAGSVSGPEVIEQYEALQKHSTYIQEQMADLEQTSASLYTLISDLEQQLEQRFRTGMDHINSSFNEFFSTLFNGGSASLQVVQVPLSKSTDDEVVEYELGVEMSVSLPNKKISNLAMLSGGERSLTSIALLFAISQSTPPPFIILDETDAALDEANSKRYGDMIEQLAQHSQLIVITHNRETMSRAGLLYGVTMGDDGMSRLLAVTLSEAESVAK